MGDDEDLFRAMEDSRHLGPMRAEVDNSGFDQRTASQALIERQKLFLSFCGL